MVHWFCIGCYVSYVESAMTLRQWLFDNLGFDLYDWSDDDIRF